VLAHAAHRVKFNPALLAGLAALAWACCAAAQPQAAIEQRVAALLGRMTLDENSGRCRNPQQWAKPAFRKHPAGDSARPMGILPQRRQSGRPRRSAAHRPPRKPARHSAPFGRDVIHGYRTIFPIPLGQASSWDPELVEQAARIAAGEAALEGIRWAFAPMLDVARDPRWGRIAESPGEDPYLGAAMGAAVVRGFQGKSLADPSSVACLRQAFCRLWRRGKPAAIITARGCPRCFARCLPAPVSCRGECRRGQLHDVVQHTQRLLPATGSMFLLGTILPR